MNNKNEKIVKRITINDVAFDPNQDGQYLLTEMWRTFGEGKKCKKPNEWRRTDQATELMAELKDGKSHLLVRGGRTGGTWASEQIALSYLAWLSPQAQIGINQIVLERMEELENPELALKRGNERAIEGYKRQGKSDTWIAERLNGKSVRHDLTDTLASRGVEKYGYANCTNAIYEPILGGKTQELKATRQLAKNDSLRDNLSRRELSFVRFAEELAEMRMEADGAWGNVQCEKTCRMAGEVTKNAIKQAMNN